MTCSREPQNVDEHTWYYEYPGSILVVRECRDENGVLKHPTTNFRIPWKMLEASRLRRPKSRKRKP